MAPLAGLEHGPLATFWSKAGHFLFRHGEHFYNFQGVKQFKEKFDPVWEPRFLACPGSLSLPTILLNYASLVAGSVKGMVLK